MAKAERDYAQIAKYIIHKEEQQQSSLLKRAML